MKIVIDIPDRIYKINQNRTLNITDDEILEKALRNGTPLPKGHGKLITEPTEEEIAETIGGRNDFADCIREAVKTVFANATPIIEADKPESEG